MDKIEIKVLNPEVLQEAEKMAVCSARLTQSGHRVKTLDDFMALYEKPFTYKFVENLVALPHPTLQKFAAINVVIVGASRRFLAQITRHQNEVKFMSASLQYSDYSDDSAFVVPYEVLQRGYVAENQYLKTCRVVMDEYKEAVKAGISNDAAGYMAPQGLRNVLIISATPYQWAHMISQRTCRRNTTETRYVMLKIWEELYNLSTLLFDMSGPFCTKEKCKEGKMSCGRIIDSNLTPKGILNMDFPLFRKEVSL